MAAETDLLVVGAGAKAAGVAAKAHAMNSLGLGPVTVTIVEGTEVAASWLGRNGMTSGEEPLAVTPIKDIGFPYRSHEAFGAAGEEIDGLVMDFSWQRYMVGLRRYARWVDAGSPQVRHRDYGEYLQWVLGRAREGIERLSGRVDRIELDPDGERWAVEVDASSGPDRFSAGALMLTGPGVHRRFPHDPESEPRVLHCDSPREELARLPAGEPVDVGIVGGGESALSCLMFLRSLRPLARYAIYTPLLPMSRGESFLENRVFSDPDDVGWTGLDQVTRRDFVKHSDRGVFDPPSLEAIAYDDRCRFVTGRVNGAESARGGEAVRLLHDAPDGPRRPEHDFVVNCTGFDLLAQLRGLFPEAAREAIEARTGPLWEAPAGTEVPVGRNLELRGMSPRLHVPGLAGLSQGPGFANLGALGLLANRVLEPLYLTSSDLSNRVAKWELALAGRGSSRSPADGEGR